MSKAPKPVFVCQECGSQSSKWLGRCPDCESWNSFVEERPVETTAGAGLAAAIATALPGGTQGARRYADVALSDTPRLTAGIDEFDRVLGGGIVPGSLVLLGGEPGIGKSTLLLQAAANFARAARPGALRLGRGIGAPDQGPRRAARRRRGAAVPARRDLRRAHPRGDRPGAATAAGGRLDPDGVLAQVPVGAGQHRPGARGGDAVPVHRQGPRPADVPGRPRHQGRQPRRPEGARTRRRHGALLRGRAPPLAPRGAGDQEPLRRGVASSASSR